MIKREKQWNQNYNQLVSRGKGNSDTKTHQHNEAGLITVWWNNGSGTGSVVVTQQATTLSIYSTITLRWSGNRQKNRTTTQSWQHRHSLAAELQDGPGLFEQSTAVIVKQAAYAHWRRRWQQCVDAVALLNMSTVRSTSMAMHGWQHHGEEAAALQTTC